MESNAVAITTEIGSLTLRPDGILHAVFDFDGKLTEDIAARYVAVRNELLGDNSPPVLIQIVNFPYVERPIRMLLLGGLAIPPCRAVVSADPTLITLWRTFQLVSPVEVPSAVFPSLELAIEWIHEQMAAT